MNKINKAFGNICSPIFDGIEQDVVYRIKSKDRVEEDHITTTAFTILEERINNYQASGFRIRARQFPGRGPNSEESIFGADGALILYVNLENIEFQKIVLLQAKSFNKPSSKFDNRSIHQRYRMLSITSDSFFLVYQKDRIDLVSAFLVGFGDRLAKLPIKTFSDFLKDYFNCFIGDHIFDYPWRFIPWIDSFRDFSKLAERWPLAKNNLSIRIEDELVRTEK